MNEADLMLLPFDQFSRQKAVRSIVNNLRDSTNKLKILDVGGHSGKTREFFESDEVYVADVQEADGPNYTQVTGVTLPFKDRTFDYSMSFDTLEHIPRDERESFLLESLRVSQHGIFVAAPFDDEFGSTSTAEQAANNFYVEVMGKEHRWLKEHIQYGIPTYSDIAQFCENNSLHLAFMKANEITLWLFMQQYIFLAEKEPELFKNMANINAFYNTHSDNLEGFAQDQKAYRRIYFISDSKDSVAKAENIIAELYPSALERLEYTFGLISQINSGVLEMIKVFQPIKDQFLENNK